MAIEEVMISSSCETHTWEMHQIFRAGLGLTVLNVQLCKQSKFSSFRFSGSGSLSVMLHGTASSSCAAMPCGSGCSCVALKPFRNRSEHVEVFSRSSSLQRGGEDWTLGREPTERLRAECCCWPQIGGWSPLGPPPVPARKRAPGCCDAGDGFHLRAIGL